jgi:hypothetical protein
LESSNCNTTFLNTESMNLLGHTFSEGLEKPTSQTPENVGIES